MDSERCDDCGEEMERVGSRTLQCPCCGMRRRCGAIPQVLSVEDAQLYLTEED